MTYALLMFSIIYDFDYILFRLLIMLNMLRFKSSDLVGTHTLLDKSLRVLQLPAHLSNLTENG